MSDAGKELAELKREIVETRNQAIKTDNQVKNLTLDIKGFEKRFDGLESRVRLSSVGVNLIVAVTIAVAAYMVSAMRIKNYESEVTALKAEVKDEHEAAQSKNDELHTKLSDLEKKRRLHDQAGDVAVQIVGFLDKQQDKEAADLLDKFDSEGLSPLERKLVDKRFGELRHREAEAKYKSGRAAVLAVHPDSAVPDLRRSLVLEPDGQHADAVRYLLATSLWSLKHFDEAEPLFREIIKKEADKTVTEEVRYLLATALARLDRRDEAKSAFNAIVNANGHYAASAKAYLSALENGSELPTDLPGGRVRVARPKADAPAADAH